nr:hypothetical protein [Tanacetum cinerariifolium]
MMLLARAITQKFSTPTNNRLRTSSNIRNQAMIQDDQVDIQTKNASYSGNNNNNAGRQSRNQVFNAGNGNDDIDGNAKTVPSYDAKPVSKVNASSKVHEQMRHEKRKTVIQTSDDDQIDSNIIFNNPYVENNGGTSDHDSNDHDEYQKIKCWHMMFKEKLKIKKRLHNELKKQKMLLQKELKMCKDRGQSIQTIHMLGKTLNKFYDPFLKAGLGYKNPERLKKAIAAQPKMYDGEKLHSVNLKIHSPNSEETLEDAKESRLKMRNKMVQINYGKLYALYETFVP